MLRRIYKYNTDNIKNKQKIIINTTVTKAVLSLNAGVMKPTLYRSFIIGAVWFLVQFVFQNLVKGIVNYYCAILSVGTNFRHPVNRKPREKPFPGSQVKSIYLLAQKIAGSSII